LAGERRVLLIYQLSEKAYHNYTHNEAGVKIKSKKDVIKIINQQYRLIEKITDIRIKNRK